MITACVIFAEDLPLPTQFYFHLGFSLEEAVENEYSLLPANGSELILVQTPHHITETISISSPPEVRSETPVKITFEVNCIDLVVKEIPSLGGRIEDNMHEWTSRGHTERDTADPEGNVFQLRAKGGR